MEVIKTKQQFSWLGDVNEKGVIINTNHELCGQSITGKELHFPGASGSTVGPDALVNLARKGYAPSKIIIERKNDNATIWGSIFGKVPLEITGKKPKPIEKSQLEKLGIPADVLEYVYKASEYLDFEEFIPITSPIQIAGVSYKTVKDAGLKIREDFSNKFKVKVPSVLNPAGMDLENWKKQRIPEDFAEKQMRIIRAYERMGAEPTCTCIPYYTGTLGIPFSETFWSESSAVSFANSVLGLKTNKESGLGSLLWAIAGYGPRYGLHLDKNRNPKVEIKVNAILKTTDDFGTLGYALGETIGDKVPYLRGIEPTDVSLDKLKSLGAAAAASGDIPLYHIKDITPEARAKTISLGEMEHMEMGEKELLDAREKLNKGNVKDIDLVAFGCPHASHREIKEIAELLPGKKLKEGVDLWVCTARAEKAWSDKFGYTSVIERAGGRVYCDTCMVVAPIERIGYKTTATNSGKAAYYLPNLCKQKVVFDNTEKIIEMVTR